MSKKRSNATRRAEHLAASERAAAIRKEQERRERRRRSLLVGGLVAAVLTILLGAGYAIQAARDTTGQVSAPPAGVVDDYGVPRGDAAAPVTVTVYEDFMCPFCGDFEEGSRELLSSYVESGEARVEYRVVAWLDRFSDGSDYSTRAMNALGVVLDTAGADAAIRMHDLLFEQQPEEGTKGLSDDELIDLAVEAGADQSEVEAPIRDRKFEQWTKNASDEASKDKVAQTPTVMVDGEVVEFERIDELLAAVDAAVGAAVRAG